MKGLSERYYDMERKKRMKKTKIIKQCIIILAGMFLMLLASVGFMIQTFGQEVEQEGIPALRVGDGNRVSCLNVWSADGGASSQPMTIYYNGTDGGVGAPQIIYVRDENVNTVFCIQYGSQLSSGNVMDTCSEEAYQRLNERQKLGIAQVLGCAAMKYAPRDGEGGYNVRNTGSCTFPNFQLYNATQLMIWYYIDCYSDAPGAGNTGGITWDGVVRTCNAGWASLSECERIKNTVDHIYDLPGFCGERPEQAPVVELKYNKATNVYEGIVTDERNCLDGFQLLEAEGMEWYRCLPDGTPNEAGNSVMIRSRYSLGSRQQPLVLTWNRKVTGSSLNYLLNRSEPQDLVFFMGNKEETVSGYLSITTERIPTIELLKKDAATGESLPGITLQLLEGDTVLEEWITTDAPHYVKGLKIGGRYRLHEVLPLEGYASTEDVEFTVADTEDIQTVTMENTVITGSIILTKVNGKKGTALEGVTFELFKKADGVETPMDRQYSGQNQTFHGKKQEESDFYIGTYTTDDQGTIRIDTLDYGSYYFVEIKSLPGFLRSGDYYDFTIDQAEKKIAITVSNQPVEPTTEATTAQPTTEQPTTEQPSTELELSTEPATVVAGVSIWKEVETPKTGDCGIPVVVLLGLVLSRILFHIISKKGINR